MRKRGVIIETEVIKKITEASEQIEPKQASELLESNQKQHSNPNSNDNKNDAPVTLDDSKFDPKDNRNTLPAKKTSEQPLQSPTPVCITDVNILEKHSVDSNIKPENQSKDGIDLNINVTKDKTQNTSKVPDYKNRYASDSKINPNTIDIESNKRTTPTVFTSGNHKKQNNTNIKLKSLVNKKIEDNKSSTTQVEPHNVPKAEEISLPLSDTSIPASVVINKELPKPSAQMSLEDKTTLNIPTADNKVLNKPERYKTLEEKLEDAKNAIVDENLVPKHKKPFNSKKKSNHPQSSLPNQKLPGIFGSIISGNNNQPIVQRTNTNPYDHHNKTDYHPNKTNYHPNKPDDINSKDENASKTLKFQPLEKKVAPFKGNLVTTSETESVHIKETIEDIKPPKDPDFDNKETSKDSIDSINSIDTKTPLPNKQSDSNPASTLVIPMNIKMPDIVPVIESEHLNSEVQKTNKESRKILTTPNKIIDITITIAITSLGRGMGCSHFSKSLATYIKTVLKKNVCIVNYLGQIEMEGYEVYPQSELSKLYDRYDFIILDLGPYSPKLQSEVFRAPIRIMCSLFEEKYNKELAFFIKNMEYPEKWHYFFNNVPKNKRRHVADMMEDYSFWCAPPYYDKELTKDISKKFAEIIGGKR